MGPLRRILGALFGAPPPKPEDIVFEPIEAPSEEVFSRPEAGTAGAESGGSPAAQARKEEPLPGPLVPSRSAKGLARTVALGELLPLVPSAWRRSVHYAPEQTIVLPAEARLDMGVERPLAFSLRYLAKSHPQWFRDPGPYETDLGVDLWMEPFRDPEASPVEVDVPAELVVEAAEERDTFLQWEGEKRSSREVRKEERETDKALRSVKMPPLLMRVEGEFQDLLRTPAEASPPVPKAASRAGAPAARAASSPQAAPNPRLRKILEAYADGLSAPLAQQVSPPQPLQGIASAGSGDVPRVQGRKEATPPQGGAAVTPPARWEQVASKPEPASALKPAVPAAAGGYEMRFEELGLSLSRFTEVRGFGLWQGGVAQHTGDLGFDARNAAAREKLERILADALSTQGAQDGFLSVTVHHARGGISVFGGGPCLVAVAHHADGLPAHLRSWLCGWVSQPLRG
jgi:hypothetical protein